MNEGMQDIFLVHFYGIDDEGHIYGAGVVEEENVMSGVDDAVGQILAGVPAEMLAIIFADHGLRRVDFEGRRGKNEHLIPHDMFIPIFMTVK
jgi:predicted AlkP superfamily pyrophosphatase or phosphodiesterase